MVEAGVPGCTCGGQYSGYPTMPVEHARHLAEKIVPEIIAGILGQSSPGLPERVPAQA
ncbi:hypothetical protein [Sinomonas terrae]|uniref:Uncharacterized protein n=1 Tax=Sinomonas terrae TaxID=2908838 RepID=A0ABS9U0D4_9MICC|nr:hypothetical protein [Sinomonas terrae]MCH6469872.1 hypothetical protein [Sinomonas terrae]